MRTALSAREEGSGVWLASAVASFVVCSLLFVAGPMVVARLLKPYATMTYRNAKDRDSSGCRYFSFVHALVVTALNFYILLATDTFDDSPSNKDPVPLMWRYSLLSRVSLGISLGYFLLDALLVAWYMPAMGGMEMETHHIAAFLSVFVTVWYREVHMYTLILLATECTTPFINFRWLLEKMNWKHTVWYKMNGIALVLSWILVRIVMFVFFFVHLYHRRDQLWRLHWPVGVAILTVPPLLSALNLLWFSKIARGALKLFFGAQSGKVSQPIPAGKAE